MKGLVFLINDPKDKTKIAKFPFSKVIENVVSNPT